MQVTYEQYFILILEVDAEWSRRRDSSSLQPYLRTMAALNDFCAGYRQSQELLLSQMSNASKQEVFAEYRHLLRPAFYIPWGDPDCHVVILLDDLQMVHEIAAHLDVAVERISIGFCPKLHDSSRDLHSLKNVLLSGAASQAGAEESNSQFQPHALPMQAQTPLLLFARLKLDAFMQVGFGLLFQEAFYELLPTLVAKAKDRLLKSLESQNCSCKTMSESDVRDAKVCVVDLQGSEEVGLLIFTSNYSVAMQIVLEIRRTTYADFSSASEHGPRLISAIKSSNVYQRLTNVHASSPGANFEGFSDNHILRWTQSTASVSVDAFFIENSAGFEKSNGMVAAHMDFKVPPGHMRELSSTLSSSLGNTDRDETCNRDCVPGGIKLGTHEACRVLGSSSGEERIPLRSLITFARGVRERFGRSTVPPTARNISDTNTSLTIPVLVDHLAPLGELHSPLFGLALAEVQLRLFSSEFEGRLNLQKLSQAMPLYGVPISLQQTVNRLYREFSILMGDYFQFDCVLNLYDVFAALHATLADHLLETRRLEIAGSLGGHIPLLGGSRLEHISGIVQALNDGLSHRIPRDLTRRFVSDGLRGGINQIVSAADVILKCGTGLLRQGIFEAGTETARESVGGVMSISVRPGVQAFALNLGTEKQARLFYVEIDSTRITHIGSYCDYLHEAAHLAFAAYRSEGMGGEIGSLNGSFNGERIEEIFANLIVRMTVFGDLAVGSRRTREFLVHHLIATEKARYGEEGSDEEMVRQYGELLVRLCIADLLCPPLQSPEAMTEFVPPQLATELERLDVISQFIEMGIIALPKGKKFWSPGKFGFQYCVAAFEDAFPKLQPNLDELWSWAFRLLAPFTRHGGERAALEERVKTALDESRPFSRLAEDRLGDADAVGVDSLLLVSSLLSAYVGHQEFDPDTELYVPRNTQTGKIDFQQGQGRWNTFLIDRGRATMFCVDPHERGARLAKQVAVYKTLWDVATQFNGRRLVDIIDANWPHSSR